MPVVVLLIVLAVIVFLLAKSLQDAKRQHDGAAPTSATRGPAPTTPRPARQRARRRRPALDEEALEAHVGKLRDAVATGLISAEEAVDSIVRQTDGIVGQEAARKLLHQDDAA
jgi:hypothetical protein